MGFINQLSNLKNVLEKLSNIPAASPVSRSPGHNCGFKESSNPSSRWVYSARAQGAKVTSQEKFICSLRAPKGLRPKRYGYAPNKSMVIG